MAKAQRTTHRSSAGKKLYAVRDADGQFKDIQTFERAHRMDLKRTSKAEGAAKAAKRAARKATAKAGGTAATKKTVKKAVKKAATPARKAR